MVQYEIFSTCAKQRYRASLCSNATIVITLVNVLTFLIPFILAYRSEGLWLKKNTYREQPDVHFKYEYLFLLETEKVEIPVICTNFANLASFVQKFNHCPEIKVIEEDLNKDSKKDFLHFEIQALLPATENVYNVILLLLFDYRLHSHSQLVMEGMALFEKASPLEGARRVDGVGDLRLAQRRLLRDQGKEAEEEVAAPVVRPGSTFDLPTLLRDYAARNVSTRLEGVYAHWGRGRAPGEGFTLSLTVHYPEEEVAYRPGLWETLRAAWLQVLALLAPSLILSRSIKHFILSNYIVHSVQIQPWKNIKQF